MGCIETLPKTSFTEYGSPYLQWQSLHLGNLDGRWICTSGDSLRDGLLGNLLQKGRRSGTLGGLDGVDDSADAGNGSTNGIGHARPPRF
jgi:hypothetical protein